MAEEKSKWEKPEGEPLFVAISATDGDYKAAYARAEETFPHFLKAINKPEFSVGSGTTNGVKLRIRDRDLSEKLGEDRFVYLWFYDVRAEEGDYSAEIYELPKDGINDYQIGQRMRFLPEHIYDWLIVRDGHLWGGLTIRLVRARQSEDEKHNFDAYSGFFVYEELLP